MHIDSTSCSCFINVFCKNIICPANKNTTTPTIPHSAKLKSATAMLLTFYRGGGDLNEEGSEEHRMAFHDCNSFRILIIMYTSVATDTHICNTIGRFNHHTPTPTIPFVIVFTLSIITFFLLSYFANNMLKASPHIKTPIME